MRISLLILMLFVTAGSFAQEMAVPDLFNMLDWQHFRIDTTLKKKGYVLMQKDVDSGSAIYQYSHLERNEDKPTTVRSFVIMDVMSEKARSRLINYRTYSQDEYVKIAGWLLANGYVTKDKYAFENQQHVVYTNGKETVRVKIIKTKLDNKEFISYELELGK
jgi:hypothetical protein